MSDPYMALKVNVLLGWDYDFGVCIYLVFVLFLVHKLCLLVIKVCNGTTPASERLDRCLQGY